MADVDADGDAGAPTRAVHGPVFDVRKWNSGAHPPAPTFEVRRAPGAGCPSTGGAVGAALMARGEGA